VSESRLTALAVFAIRSGPAASGAQALGLSLFFAPLSAVDLPARPAVHA
jgi:hypothetical protein